jgi:hypothetical protein
MFILSLRCDKAFFPAAWSLLSFPLRFKSTLVCLAFAVDPLLEGFIGTRSDLGGAIDGGSSQETQVCSDRSHAPAPTAGGIVSMRKLRDHEWPSGMLSGYDPRIGV